MNSECDNNSLMYYVGGLVQMSYEINSGCLKNNWSKPYGKKYELRTYVLDDIIYFSQVTNPEFVSKYVKHNLTKPCRSMELNKK
jgi:hypothetical protein